MTHLFLYLVYSFQDHTLALAVSKDENFLPRSVLPPNSLATAYPMPAILPPLIARIHLFTPLPSDYSAHILSMLFGMICMFPPVYPNLACISLAKPYMLA